MRSETSRKSGTQGTSAPISAERWDAMMSIFADAVELPPSERSAFLAQACGTDAELGKEVESLLAAHDGDATFLESPVVAAADRNAQELGARLQAALGTAFRVERELAGGGMSRVFVAEETKLGRRVVVKVLPPELRAVLSAERFDRETRLAAALRHPHIVPLLAAGESADGLVYFTMPFIEGQSLEQRLEREGRLPLAEVAAIVREVADALAYAHANGVVHRDVKPANVLIDGGHAVVADFGVAKAIALAAGEREPAERASGAQDLPSETHHRRLRDRHAGVHEPRTGQGPRRRRPQRRLQPGLHDVRDAHRTAAVSRIRHRGHRLPQNRGGAERNQSGFATGSRRGTGARACRAAGRPVPEHDRTGRGVQRGGRLAGRSPRWARPSDAAPVATALDRSCGVGRHSRRVGRRGGATSCVDHCPSRCCHSGCRA